MDVSIMGYIVGGGILTLLLSWASIWGLSRWANHGKFLVPPSDRGLHTKPTPTGGGVAIAGLTMIGMWIMVVCHPPTDYSWTSLALLTLGALLIAGVSWWDDLHPLSQRFRLLIHSISASLAIYAFGFYDTITLPLSMQVYDLGWFGLLLSFFWIVGLTNAYNFIDGIDGIAGSQAVVAGLGWFLLGMLLGQPLVGALGLLLAMSNLGFLFHNWHPARIFMGDVGSTFLGYIFAVLPLMLHHTQQISTTTTLIIGVLFLWILLFDTAHTLLSRLYAGEDIFASHRAHLYQRLVLAGHGHQHVALLYAILALFGGILAIFWVYLPHPAMFFMTVLIIPTLCLWLWSFVQFQERSHTIPLVVVVHQVHMPQRTPRGLGGGLSDGVSTPRARATIDTPHGD